MVQCDQCHAPMQPDHMPEEGVKYPIWSCKCGFFCDRTQYIPSVDKDGGAKVSSFKIEHTGLKNVI
jgi:hypothetical protein